MKKKYYQSGFTMIEILIVFLLIAIAVTIMLGPNLINSRKRAKDAVRKHDLVQISKALEAYANDNGNYPLSDNAGRIVGCDAGGAMVACNWGQPWVGKNETSYMGELPKDPNQFQNYIYAASPTGQFYEIFARLEATDDPVVDKNKDGNYVPADDEYQYAYATCGTGQCNYGISSSNASMTQDVTLLP
jgi:prepilin-type N-terminal cleavage/methylation domain-containing protein